MISKNLSARLTSALIFSHSNTLLEIKMHSQRVTEAITAGSHIALHFHDFTNTAVGAEVL